MSFERQGLLLPSSLKTDLPPVDLNLFSSIQAAKEGVQSSITELRLSDVQAERVTRAWHNGEDASLSLGTLDDEERGRKEAFFSEKIEHLKEWKKKLLLDDTLEPDLKQIYRWSINEEIAQQRMFVASMKGDNEGFLRWNGFIYGRPDETIYRAALDWVGADAEKLLMQNPSTATREAAEMVTTIIKGKRGYRELLAPSADNFSAVQELHTGKDGFYESLFEGVVIPEGTITPLEGDPVLGHILAQTLGTNLQIQDSPVSTWGVSKTGVRRPQEYELTPVRFKALLGHEVGSHVLERLNGERGPLLLALTGLDRRVSSSEGRALIREQVLSPTFEAFGREERWQGILKRHIAISYAMGIGEEGLKSSSEVYKFIYAINRMYEGGRLPDDERVAQMAAREKTDNLLLRVLKGTNGKGGAYLKDIAYLEGNVACWRAAELNGAQYLMLGDLGRFDITNPRHVLFLQKLGLLPGSNVRF